MFALRGEANSLKRLTDSLLPAVKFRIANVVWRWTPSSYLPEWRDSVPRAELGWQT